MGFQTWANQVYYLSCHSFHDVKEYIQAYLSQLENKLFLTEDKTELYMFFSNCLEVSYHIHAFSFANSWNHMVYAMK